MTIFNPSALVAALLLAAAFPAQAAPVTATPAQAPAPAATQPLPAGVNPFVGASLGLESLRQQIEVAKATTVLMQERVAQKNAEIELDQLPIKRKNELKRTLSSGIAGGMPSLPSIDLGDGSSGVKAKFKAKPKKPAAEALVAAPQQPAAPVVELLGVSETKGDLSATLSLDGDVAVVKNGDMTRMGRVEVSASGVRVGGVRAVMHTATLARQTVPEAAPMQGAGMGGGSAIPVTRAGAGPGGMQMPPPSTGNLFPPGLRAN